MPTLQPRRDLPDMSAEMVAARRFGQSWRGYDQEEVKQFLADVAGQMRALRERAEVAESARREAEAKAAHPRLDEATLMSALGEETAEILRSAHNAAGEVLAKAETAAEQVVAGAESKAKELIAQAESLLAERTAEAEQAAEEVLQQAQAQADDARSQAEEQAAVLSAEAQSRHDEMVKSAEATRERVLGDLARRRRLATVQIEQLRAGRERLLVAYLAVRRTLDEVTDELQRADAEARAAADAVGRQHTAEVAELGGGHVQDVWETTGPSGEVPVIVLAPKAGELAAAGDNRPAGVAEKASTEKSGGNRATPDKPRTEPSSGAGWEDLGPGQRGALVAPAAEFESVRILRPVGEAGQSEVQPEAQLPQAKAAAAGPATPTADEPAAPPEPAAVSAPTTGEVPIAAPAPGSSAREARAPDTAREGPAREEVSEGAAGAQAEIWRGEEHAGEEQATAGEPDVEDLFARIRAGRAEATSKARRTLEGSNGRQAGARPDEEDGPGPLTPPGGSPAAQAGAGSESSFFMQRDLVAGRLEASLARKLKRALQDEQNALLDRLRSLKGLPSPESVLPSAEEHPDRFVEAGKPLLEEAAREGIQVAAKSYGCAAAGTKLGVEVVEDLAEELGKAITEPLRQRLEQAISSGGEPSELADAFGAAYREWKTQRIEATAHDEVAAAFARGAYVALPEGARLRWLVDAAEGPCPDCEDNALAPVQQKGEPWPTGQLHPPAHPGCRCALAPEPADLAAPAPVADGPGSVRRGAATNA